MPNPYSHLPIKMADNDSEETAIYHTMQPVPLTLHQETIDPLSNTKPAGSEVRTAHPGVDANTKLQYKLGDPTGVASVSGVVNVSGFFVRPDGVRVELTRTSQQSNPLPGQPKPGPTKSSSVSKSRYNVAVGPLTNSPAVKQASRGRRTDQRVPNQRSGTGRRSKNAMFNLVPVPSPSEGIPVVQPQVAAASRPVEPPPQVKYGHQLPAMVSFPQQRAADGSRSVVAEKRTSDTQRAPPPQPPPQQQQQQQQQQQFAVDPSYNLYMAVECHRATGQDEDGDTPLHIALAQETVDVRLVFRLVELIKLAGKTLDIFNDMQQTPLHIAAITGNPQASKILVEHGSNANETDRNGQTAMHNVCSNPCKGSRDTLDAILRFSKVKLEVDKRNYSGFSPLHISVKYKLLELSKVLVDGGANTNALDAKSGWTPLFHAVTNQDADHVQILLRAGAQVNMQSYSGNTALHVATGRGFTEIVRLLMRYGADMSLRNTHKDTPVMVAQDNNQMSNILRGVSSSSPSMGSSPQYSSPSPHHLPMTNGMSHKPSPPPSQNTNYPVPAQTAAPLGKQGDTAVKKPRAPRKDKGIRRVSSAAKNETSVSQPEAPTTTASISVASDRSNASQDESDAVVPTSRRVSVIVDCKSLKRRLIERTEQDGQDRQGGTPSPQQVAEVPLSKKPKNQFRLSVKESQGGIGLPDFVQVRLVETVSADQCEPMDLTKSKPKGTCEITEQRVVLTNGQTEATPLRKVKVKSEPEAEKHPMQNGDASDKKDSESQVNTVDIKEPTDVVKTVDEVSTTTSSEAREEDQVNAEEEDPQTIDDAPKATTPKKDRKRKKSERLPPKKRK